jgi:8-oxo-dGTP diphosphatase
MTDEQLFHVGVKGLITNKDGRILLMDEDVSTHLTPTTKYWDLPGGRVQEGETILETLAREIFEETGIKEISDPTFRTAVLSNHRIKLKTGITVSLILMVYAVNIPEDSKIVLSHEHLGYEWVDLEVARERLQHKYPKEFTAQL